jgi:hypothetical protein
MTSGSNIQTPLPEALTVPIIQALLRSRSFCQYDDPRLPGHTVVGWQLPNDTPDLGQAVFALEHLVRAIFGIVEGDVGWRAATYAWRERAHAAEARLRALEMAESTGIEPVRP